MEIYSQVASNPFTAKANNLTNIPLNQVTNTNLDDSTSNKKIINYLEYIESLDSKQYLSILEEFSNFINTIDNEKLPDIKKQLKQLWHLMKSNKDVNYTTTDLNTGQKLFTPKEKIKDILNNLRNQKKMSYNYKMNIKTSAEKEDDKKKKKRGNPFKVLMGQVGKLLDHGMKKKDISRYLMKKGYWSEETISKAVDIVMDYNKDKKNKDNTKTSNSFNYKRHIAQNTNTPEVDETELMLNYIERYDEQINKGDASFIPIRDAYINQLLDDVLNSRLNIDGPQSLRLRKAVSLLKEGDTYADNNSNYALAVSKNKIKVAETWAEMNPEYPKENSGKNSDLDIKFMMSLHSNRFTFQQYLLNYKGDESKNFAEEFVNNFEQELINFESEINNLNLENQEKLKNRTNWYNRAKKELDSTNNVELNSAFVSAAQTFAIFRENYIQNKDKTSALALYNFINKELMPFNLRAEELNADNQEWLLGKMIPWRERLEKEYGFKYLKIANALNLNYKNCSSGELFSRLNWLNSLKSFDNDKHQEGRVAASIKGAAEEITQIKEALKFRGFGKEEIENFKDM